MNFDFLDRRSAERFAELLDESTGGRRHHSRGQADEQLAELVTIGSNLSAARSGVRVDPEFRTGLRAMLVATAERDGIGRAATAVETETATARAATSRTGLRAGRLGHGLLGHSGRIRARGAIVIGVAAGALAVSGISAASENASPGDALYGVKRSTERAQLAMAGSDVTRGQLSLDFARTRLAEAVAMQGDDAGFGGVLDDMDADTLKGVKLLTTSAVARKDIKPLTTIDNFADQQRQTLSPALGKLTGKNQERAQTSLSLLDSVNKRAENLRTGLGCDTVTSAGSDKLGPKLRGCAADADSDSPAITRSPGQTGKATPRPGSKGDVKADPKQIDPAITPTASADAKIPSGERTTTIVPELPLGGTTVQPTTTADETQPKQKRQKQQQQQQLDEPVEGEDSGLGGLLGNITGSN